MRFFFKWTFVLFNLLMLATMVEYWSNFSASMSDGEALGGVIGTGLILAFWAMGDIILGMFVLFTRRQS